MGRDQNLSTTSLPEEHGTKPLSSKPDHNRSFLEVATDKINANLRLFRLLPWTLASIGAFLVYKHSRHPLRRFTKISEITSSCISSNIPLYGVVVLVSGEYVSVWHIPLWRKLLRIRHRPPDLPLTDQLIKLRFAGVSVGCQREAEVWLQDQLIRRTIIFTPLLVNQNTLESIVYSRLKGSFNVKSVCINRELIARGIGSLREVYGVKDDRTHSKFVQSLAASEQEAKRKGKGMWDGTEYVVWWKKLLRKIL